MRYSKLSVCGTLNCPTKFPKVSLSCPRAQNNKNCAGRNRLCDVAAGSGAEGWSRMVSGRLSIVTTCTNRVLLMNHVRVMWESSLKFCLDIPGENVVARNMLQNIIMCCRVYKTFQQPTPLVTVTLQYNLHCCSTCIHGPGKLLSYSCWRKPTRILCNSSTWLYTRRLRAEGAQYVAVLATSQGTNWLQQSPCINSDTHI